MLPSGASGGLAVEEPGGQEDAADDDRDIDDGHEGGHRAGGVPNSYERLPREWLSTIRKKNATPPSTNSVVPAPSTPVAPASLATVWQKLQVGMRRLGISADVVRGSFARDEGCRPLPLSAYRAS